MAGAHIGPIWRSVRRHRAFSLAISEAAVGFFILANLLITSRWYALHGFPPSGHREADLVEVATWSAARGPASPAAVMARQQRELDVLGTLPGVRLAAAVSSTEIDDQLAFPAVLWTTAPKVGVAAAVPGATRTPSGAVAGWTVEATPELADVIDLRFVEGQSLRALSPAEQARSVVITRCLAEALFGGPAAAIGKTMSSSRHPPARVAGVIDDIRMRSPFLYQSAVTAIFVGATGDERHGRYLLRTDAGRAPAIRAAAEQALARRAPGGHYSARLFNGGGVRVADNARGTVTVLLAVAAALGLVAVLGNLAVAAFLVGDRRRVVSVRRALGATRGDVFRYLIIENLIPTNIGCLLGLGLTLLVLPGVQHRFIGLTLRLSDVAATVMLLSLAGIAAKIVPALRATRIPPSEAGRTL